MGEATRFAIEGPERLRVLGLEAMESDGPLDGRTRFATLAEALPDGGLAVLGLAARRRKGRPAESRWVFRMDPRDGFWLASGIRYSPVAGWLLHWDAHPADVWVGDWEFGRGPRFGLWEDPVNPGELAGTRYARCGWGPEFALRDYLRLWELSGGRTEALAAAGLGGLVSPLGVKRLAGDPGFYRWARQRAGELRETEATAREALWAFRHGSDVAGAREHFRIASEWRNTWGAAPAALLGREGLLERAERWLRRSRVSLSEYGRYIGYAERAGWDTADERTLFPPPQCFAALLERAEAEARAADLAAERAGRRRLAAALRKAAGRFADGLPDPGGGMRWVLPTTAREFREEGGAMRNCLGRMGYDRKMAGGESLVAFLRRGAERVADAEISLEGRVPKVRQCYAAGNRRAPDEALAAAKALARHCGRKMRDERRAGNEE